MFPAWPCSYRSHSLAGALRLLLHLPLLRQQLQAASSLGIGVELEHGAQVLERVLLQHAPLVAVLGGADHTLKGTTGRDAKVVMW